MLRAVVRIPGGGGSKSAWNDAKMLLCHTGLGKVTAGDRWIDLVERRRAGMVLSEVVTVVQALGR